MQNQASQQRAARLWARLICYCLRLLAAEEEGEEEGEEGEEVVQSTSQHALLKGIAALFPWHAGQKLAAIRLWRLASTTTYSRAGEDSIARDLPDAVLDLSKALLCHEIYHQPYQSGLVHFLAALGINPDTLRLRTALQYSSLLSSLVYCARVLTLEAFLPSDQRSEQGAEETRALLKAWDPLPCRRFA